MNATSITPADMKAALLFAVNLGRAIQEAGPSGIPLGPLYATVSDRVTLDYFNGAVRLLRRHQVISILNDRATYTARA
jgi:hypothetical protein